jgi:prevent-host-death family protein
MTTIEIEDLQEHLFEVLRRVQEEHQIVEIISYGMVVARIVPAEEPGDTARDTVWQEMERLSEELAQYLPPNIDAVEAIRDVRRKL